MDIRRLKTFLAVCETGSLSRAAERLHISQPALTRRIQELESEYGAVLFERAKKGMTPTEAGRSLRSRDAFRNSRANTAPCSLSAPRKA